MPVTNVKPNKALKGWSDYVTTDKSNSELSRGERFYSTSGSMENFQREAASIWNAYGQRRKKMGHSLVISYKESDVDIHDPKTWDVAEEHLKITMDERFPNATWAAVAHIDGGAFHWHAYVINHDHATGKAMPMITQKSVAAASDYAAKVLGLDVIPQPMPDKAKHPMERVAELNGEAWNDVHYGQPDALERLNSANWREYLRSVIEDATRDPRAQEGLPGIVEAIEERGVSVELKASRNGPPGVSYALLDDDGEVMRFKRSKREAKAAVTGKKLGANYTTEGLLATAQEHQRLLQQQQAAQRVAEVQQKKHDVLPDQQKAAKNFRLPAGMADLLRSQYATAAGDQQDNKGGPASPAQGRQEDRPATPAYPSSTGEGLVPSPPVVRETVPVKPGTVAYGVQQQQEKERRKKQQEQQEKEKRQKG